MIRYTVSAKAREKIDRYEVDDARLDAAMSEWWQQEGLQQWALAGGSPWRTRPWVSKANRLCLTIDLYPSNPEPVIEVVDLELLSSGNGETQRV